MHGYRKFLRNTAIVAFVLTVGYLTSGCRSVRIKTSTEKNLPGYFDNDYGKLVETLSKIESRKTTLEDLKNQGVDLLHGGQNVDRIRGFKGVQAFFENGGKVIFSMDMGRFDEYLEKYSDSIFIRIPYKNVKTDSTRFYFSNKTTEIKGRDMEVTVFVRKGVIVQVDERDVNLDKIVKSHSFGSGLIELGREVGGMMKMVP